MPPPKKPKQGVTRVDQFLSPSELEELRNKSASCAIVDGFHGKDGGKTVDREMTCDIDSCSPRTVVTNQSNSSAAKEESSSDTWSHSYRNKLTSKNSEILQSLLNASSSPIKESSSGVKSSRTEIETAETSKSGVSLSSVSSDSPSGDDDGSCSSANDSDNAQAQTSQNSENSDGVPSPSNVTGHLKNGDIVRDSDTHSTAHVTTQGAGGPAFKQTETRKFESLMMRRKLDSLMDVLRPTLPEHTQSLTPCRPSEDRTISLSAPLSSEERSVNSRDTNRKSENFKEADGSESLGFHSNGVVLPAGDRQTDVRNRSIEMFEGEGKKSFPSSSRLGRSHLEWPRPASARSDDMKFNGIRSHPFVAPNDQIHRQTVTQPSLPLLSVPTYNSHTQSTNQLFLASHLHKNILNRQTMQDPLARLQMSGRPAFKSFVRPVIANSSSTMAASSGENRKPSSTETNDRLESCPGGRTSSRPTPPLNFNKNQEPVDIDYDTAIGAALQSVRTADNVISSSSEGGIKETAHSLPTPLSFDFSHPAQAEAQNGNQTSVEMQNSTIVRSVSAPNGKVSSPTELPSSTMEEHLRRSMDDKGQVRRCQICNDNASGFHYGVWSCEGCKAFFKRSLQGPVDYVCPATNTCTIDKHRRKSCQACRLRKCIEMGMSRGSCRKERRASGSRALKHKTNDFSSESSGVSPSKKLLSKECMKSPGGAAPESLASSGGVGLTSSSSAPVLPMSGARSQQQVPYSGSYSSAPQLAARGTSAFPGHQASQMAVISPFRTSVSSADAMSLAGQGFARNPVLNSHQRSVAALPTASRTSPLPHAAIHPLVEHLLRIDPPARQSGHDATKDDNELNIMSSILRLCDMELVDIINWAKSIPGYTELDLADRIHLLECCWMEILLIGLVWRSMDKADVLFLSPDLQLDKERLKRANFSQIGTQILACVRQFEKLELKHEEFVLLRCAVLLNSDLSELHNIEKIQSLKTRILEALRYTVMERGHSSTMRLVHILTLLPHTRQVAMQLIQHLLSLHMHSLLPTYALLNEMVEAFVKVHGLDWPRRPNDADPPKLHNLAPIADKLNRPSV